MYFKSASNVCTLHEGVLFLQVPRPHQTFRTIFWTVLPTSGVWFCLGMLTMPSEKSFGTLGMTLKYTPPQGTIINFDFDTSISCNFIFWNLKTMPDTCRKQYFVQKNPLFHTNPNHKQFVIFSRSTLSSFRFAIFFVQNVFILYCAAFSIISASEICSHAAFGAWSAIRRPRYGCSGRYYTTEILLLYHYYF